MNAKPDRVLIVAGEASADRYGAALVRELRRRRPDTPLEVFGPGGDGMAREGVRLLCHVRELANIGPREAISHLSRYIEVYRNILDECRQSPPRVAILLDFPDFNLRLAKKLKRAGIKVIYYISPQLWAWRRGRIRIVRDFVDKMLVILPFEEEFYREHGVAVEFVGHPLLEGFQPVRDPAGFRSRYGLDPERRTIALLPGSRRKEVDYILPTLLEASVRVMARVPAQFAISVAPTLDTRHLEQIVSNVVGAADRPHFKLVCDDARDILANVDFGFVKSGTSTLEAALVGTPFLIVYKLSAASWFAGRLLVRTRFKGLVNLIAQDLVVPEFLQGEASPGTLARVALEYLEDPAKAAVMRARLSGIRDMLSTRRASEMAAAAVSCYL
jgi:lipid-A-disaccharide synthase